MFIPHNILREPKVAALNDFRINISTTKKNNNDKVPYGLVSNIVKEASSSFTWLNRDLLNNHMHCRGKGRKKENTSTPPEIFCTIFRRRTATVIPPTQ